ncbi:MAG TPA: hypothetical protein VKM55_18950 [Candidatus Lokiarchaeia archaeon]|nr:hypothetical protein [Candidatus Lokiarchaeia archaeon]
MVEQSPISPYLVKERTADRLVIEVTVDVKRIKHTLRITLGIIELILVIYFLILLSLNALVLDPVYFLGIFIIVIMLGILLPFPPKVVSGPTTFVLDKSSDTYSIIIRQTKYTFFRRQHVLEGSQQRSRPLQFFYPLESLNNIKETEASDLRGPGTFLMRSIFKGMHVLRIQRYPPMRTPGAPRSAPVHGSIVLFGDTRLENVQSFKTMIEEFLGLPKVAGEHVIEE